MNNELLVEMINMNVIKPGTEIAILRFGTSLGGMSVATHLLRIYGAEDKNGDQDMQEISANHIVEVYECGVDKNGDAVIDAHSTVDGMTCRFGFKNIELIDHMLPEKLAGVYGLNPDGSKKKQGLKRGRKPKIRE